jgi:hypothetical protein
MRVSYAPALGCEVLHVMASDARTGKALGENRVLKLNMAEPDAALFDTGSSYAEMKPSELRAKQYEGSRAASRTDFKRLDDELDRKYLKSREGQ